MRGAGPSSPLNVSSSSNISLVVVVAEEADVCNVRPKLRMNLDWRCVSVNADGPTPRCWAGAACALDGNLVIVGGYNGGGAYHNDVYVFTPSTQVWRCLWSREGVVLPPLYAHTLDYVNSKVLAFGCLGGFFFRHSFFSCHSFFFFDLFYEEKSTQNHNVRICVLIFRV